jgi:hypothetical protein
VQVRLARAGVDHAAGRPVGPAELTGAEHVAVDRDDLKVGYEANDMGCSIDGGNRAARMRPIVQPKSLGGIGEMGSF